MQVLTRDRESHPVLERVARVFHGNYYYYVSNTDLVVVVVVCVDPWTLTLQDIRI